MLNILALSLLPFISGRVLQTPHPFNSTSSLHNESTLSRPEDVTIKEYWTHGPLNQDDIEDCLGFAQDTANSHPAGQRISLTLSPGETIFDTTFGEVICWAKMEFGAYPSYVKWSDMAQVIHLIDQVYETTRKWETLGVEGRVRGVSFMIVRIGLVKPANNHTGWTDAFDGLTS